MRKEFQDLVRELKKTMEYESGRDTNCNRNAQYSHQRIGKVTGQIGNKNTSGDHSNDSSVKISQNTETCPGDLRRFVVTPTPVEDHQLMRMWKTLK